MSVVKVFHFLLVIFFCFLFNLLKPLPFPALKHPAYVASAHASESPAAFDPPDPFTFKQSHGGENPLSSWPVACNLRPATECLRACKHHAVEPIHNF